MRCLQLNKPRIAHHGGPVATENRRPQGLLRVTFAIARRTISRMLEQYSHLPSIGMARYYVHLLKTPPRADDASTWHLRGNIALEIWTATSGETTGSPARSDHV